jgi:hypothetical protein
MLQFWWSNWRDWNRPKIESSGVNWLFVFSNTLQRKRWGLWEISPIEMYFQESVKFYRNARACPFYTFFIHFHLTFLNSGMVFQYSKHKINLISSPFQKRNRFQGARFFTWKRQNHFSETKRIIQN